ncbi:uncharacterized protein [Canis lupus baileyi]|uniref:uncharacterized protein n=1 Tax=Canis lupus baileyi TaxID=143281 RepID=UPI003B96E1D8
MSGTWGGPGSGCRGGGRVAPQPSEALGRGSRAPRPRCSLPGRCHVPPRPHASDSVESQASRDSRRPPPRPSPSGGAASVTAASAADGPSAVASGQEGRRYCVVLRSRLVCAPTRLLRTVAHLRLPRSSASFARERLRPPRSVQRAKVFSLRRLSTRTSCGFRPRKGWERGLGSPRRGRAQPTPGPGRILHKETTDKGLPRVRARASSRSFSGRWSPARPGTLAGRALVCRRAACCTPCRDHAAPPARAEPLPPVDRPAGAADQVRPETRPQRRSDARPERARPPPSALRPPPSALRPPPSALLAALTRSDAALTRLRRGWRAEEHVLLVLLGVEEKTKRSEKKQRGPTRGALEEISLLLETRREARNQEEPRDHASGRRQNREGERSAPAPRPIRCPSGSLCEPRTEVAIHCIWNTKGSHRDESTAAIAATKIGQFYVRETEMPPEGPESSSYPAGLHLL